MSSTMINNISKNSFNNSSKISNSGVLKFIKWVYYQILINLYQFSVNSCHHVWANSTWTRNHLLFGQKLKSNLSILYPPCEVDDELVLPFDKRLDNFIAVGQFRPEKNHKLLISSFGKFLAKNPDSPYKLILIGGVRNEDDSNRVKNLKSQVENLNLADKILFKPNLPYPQLKTYLQHSKFGVHGMIDEHFGIVLVEFQNNGIIPIAHNSAGPKMDIIESDKGFLYETEDKLCDIFEKVTNLSSLKITSLQTACKSGCSRFDGVQFMDKFMQDLNKVVG